MTYSDEDILHLYEDLKGVGMAETDGEAAARLIKEFLAQDYLKDLSLYMSPTRDEVFTMFSNFLSGKRIHHYFASATLVEPYLGSEKWTTFPLIFLKGKAIDSLHYFKYPDGISADKIPDIHTVATNSKYLQVYSHIHEVPPYSQTQIVKPEAFVTYGKSEWKIEPIDEDFIFKF
jgi:hypothetical protein